MDVDNNQIIVDGGSTFVERSVDGLTRLDDESLPFVVQLLLGVLVVWSSIVLARLLSRVFARSF